jgi:undecaprenyl-diphosphatase
VSVLQALVLGAVQGLTEFIPISSSGHLVLVPHALGWAEPGLAFDVLLHVGSLLALLVYFSGDLLDLYRGAVGGDRGSRKLIVLLAFATIPAVIAVLLFGDFFDRQFDDAKASAIQLVITGFILIAAEQVLARHEHRATTTGTQLRHVNDMGYLDAGAIGIAQAVAILPGISRSGSTIGAGLALSFSREEAARFAFLLAIPALFGAALFKLPDLKGSSLGFGAGAAGLIASTLTSYTAIWGLIRYLKTNNLYPFAIYCIVVGAIATILI